MSNLTRPPHDKPHLWTMIDPSLRVTLTQTRGRFTPWMRAIGHAVMLLAGAWACIGVAHANSLDTLAAFLKTTQSGRADFTQVVTSPAKPDQAVRSKTSVGSFAFVRPLRFRFDYQKPFPQTIVADGQTLWLHDADLAQVTARKQAQALGSTPAALIATAADLGALDKEFTLQAEPDANGLQLSLIHI